MLGLLPTDSESLPCVCSLAPSGSKRKYQHTLEMVRVSSTWVGIHSALANKMVESALNMGFVPEYAGFSHLFREVTVKDGCKLDFQLTWSDTMNDLDPPSRPHKKAEANVSARKGDRSVYIEVKSVTLSASRTDVNGEQFINAEFPDCVSLRAQKHAQFLTDHVRRGGEACILFLIQRDDCTSFSASPLDPEYVRVLSEASATGVKILPYLCRLNPDDGTVALLHKVPFRDTFVQTAEVAHADVSAVGAVSGTAMPVPVRVPSIKRARRPSATAKARPTTDSSPSANGSAGADDRTHDADDKDTVESNGDEAVADCESPPTTRKRRQRVHQSISIVDGSNHQEK